MNIKQFAVNKLQFLVKRLPFDYQGYWHEQYLKHGLKPRYCGVEDSKIYKGIFQRFDKLMRQFKIGHNNSILDIGCGVGVYTDYFSKRHFNNYKGIDLHTDMINELKKKYSDYKFEVKDICKENVQGKYDLILMISVTQHILLDKHFDFAMSNIYKSLNDGGLLFATDYFDKDIREAMNQRWRTLPYYTKHKLSFVDSFNFRGDSTPKQLAIFKK